MQLHKQLLKPARFQNVIGHGTVLLLINQMGDDVMALRGPGDEVVTQKHHMA
jgi:hypothetical protein